MDLSELWGAMLQVFSATDLIRLTLLVIILLLAGFLMPSYGAIFRATALALVAFAAVLYLRGLIAGSDAAVSWNDLLALKAETLLVYALTFAAAISVVFFARSMVDRR